MLTFEKVHQQIHGTSPSHYSPCQESALWSFKYWVATISRLLKIIGLFCKRILLKRLYSAKETYDFKEPTNCCHPIVNIAEGWLFTRKMILGERGAMNSLIMFLKSWHCSHLHSHMGWLRLVGSLKTQVSFAKEPYKRDYILQKRPILLRSLLIIATPWSIP